MPRPGWMEERERTRRYRHCFTCDAGGDPCGFTPYLGKDGRLVRYRCHRHPEIVFWRDTLACEDYRPRTR